MLQQTLKPEVFAAIMDHFASGQALIDGDEAHMSSDTAILEDDSEVCQSQELLVDQLAVARVVVMPDLDLGFRV